MNDHSKGYGRAMKQNAVNYFIYARLSASLFLLYIVSEEMVGLLVGIIALLFILQRLIYRKFKNFKFSIKQNNWSGYFWGLISGFTSFIAHAGGPPFQIYAIPLRLEPKVFVGSSVLIFSSSFFNCQAHLQLAIDLS